MNEEKTKYDCPKCGAGGDGYAGTWVSGMTTGGDISMKCPECGKEWVTSFQFHPQSTKVVKHIKPNY